MNLIFIGSTMGLFWFFATLAMSFIAYSLASALQGQHALQASAERRLEEAREREDAAGELLQGQLDLLEQEIRDVELDDLDTRIFRARRSAEFFERAWGMRQAHQVARLRVTYLTGLKNSRN
ncbi:hypothetical protein [Deinococcus koreensis]|uniref:hypothetical protein n=1 Tax=Deinococcus koreensis TaxID=2054903 RepID=UPI00105713D4|nr:hypothetical protein [Deinococcus koreensis]